MSSTWAGAVEMNLMVEAWLGVRTDPLHEAVIDASRADKTAADYATLMQQCFRDTLRLPVSTTSQSGCRPKNVTALSIAIGSPSPRGVSIMRMGGSR